MSNETAKAAQFEGVEFTHEGPLPVEKIRVVENVRKHFDADALRELTSNVKRDGVLNPIIVTKADEEGFYVVVCGERRLRAARAAGLPSIPARIAKGSAAALVAVQIAENLHRENLGPIEEARAFKRALDDGQMTLDGLAARFDKSIRYVTRAVRLLELPKVLLRAIEKGALTAEHGHQVLRAPEERREAIIEYALRPRWGSEGPLPTVYELRQEVERRLTKSLSSACFPLDRDFAGAGACSLCPFNSANQDVLFEGATGGNCLNGSCYTKKQNQAFRDFRDEAGARRYKGLKFAGYAGMDWGTPSEIGGALVLSAEESKSAAVAALRQASPEKFGFAVLKPSRHSDGALRAVLVCHDADFVREKLRKESERPAEKPRDPEAARREEFVRDFTRRALFVAAAKAVRIVKKEHLVAIVLRLDGVQEAYAAVGLEGDDLPAALKKLSEKELLKLAWLCAVGSQFDTRLDKDLAAAGVEVKRVRKEARGEALTAYAAAQAQRAAEAAQEKSGEKA